MRGGRRGCTAGVAQHGGHLVRNRSRACVRDDINGLTAQQTHHLLSCVHDRCLSLHGMHCCHVAVPVACCPRLQPGARTHHASCRLRAALSSRPGRRAWSGRRTRRRVLCGAHDRRAWGQSRCSTSAPAAWVVSKCRRVPAWTAPNTGVSAGSSRLALARCAAWTGAS